MNHVYRLVWNDLQRTHVPAAECKAARGKTRGDAVASPIPAAAAAGAPRALRRLSLWLALAFAPAAALALPQDGSVVAGSVTADQPDAGTLVLTQGSERLIIDWQSFGIAAGERVSFVQPSAQSVALNRVLGGDPSAIHGSLDANGQVFLVNPSGILFGQNASVSVGGLVASTLDIADEDFLGGVYRFQGPANPASVHNQGTLRAADGGTVSLLGGQVHNDGTVEARLGSVNLGAGSAMTLDFTGDGLLNVAVQAGAMEALVRNGGLIKADGSAVRLLASAADSLVQAVVNNEGVIEALELRIDETGDGEYDFRRGGSIRLVAEGDQGLVQVGGTLSAEGDNLFMPGEGLVETSGSKVPPQVGAEVSAGEGGQWNLVARQVEVDEDAAQLLSSTLGSGTSVSLNAVDGGSLAVKGDLAWEGQATLDLVAEGDMVLDGALLGEGLALQSGGTISSTGYLSVRTFTLWGGRWSQLGETLPGFNAQDFRIEGGSFLRALGGDGSAGNPYRLTDIYGVQGMGSEGLLDRHFRLANDIDAVQTSSWWWDGTTYSGGFDPEDQLPDGLGFVPIGSASSAFTGSLDGAGHALSLLHIRRDQAQTPPGEADEPQLPVDTGLFGHIRGAAISNVSLKYASVKGGDRVGALVGTSDAGTVSNSHLLDFGNVQGSTGVGGLVGHNIGGATIVDSSVEESWVQGVADVGGLAGYSGGQGSAITGSQASAGLQGSERVGGLVGHLAEGATLGGSHASGTVAGDTGVGGLVGVSSGASHIEDSHASGTVQGHASVGGLVGENRSGSVVDDSSASGAVTGLDEQIPGPEQDGEPTYTQVPSSGVGGLVGWNRGGSTVRDSQASGAVTGNSRVGGLVGNNDDHALIRGSQASGTVFGGKAVGGLAGSNEAASAIEGSQASGQVFGQEGAGGLVGLNQGASRIEKSSASGGAIGLLRVGGLVGDNRDHALILDSSATGFAVGSGEIGGLAGRNSGYSSISGSSASGKVSYAMGGGTMGGLVGLNEDHSSIAGSSASGDVSAMLQVGGLVGRNTGSSTITDSHASGSASASNVVGGLVGENSAYASIAGSHASGAVSGGVSVGGLVGLNTNHASIDRSHASGTVTGGILVGGLVGVNGISERFTYDFSNPWEPPQKVANVGQASITGSHASGTVNGGSGTGGLVGLNSDHSLISGSHATGTVHAPAQSMQVGHYDPDTGEVTFSTITVDTHGVGGLVGINGGYWDIEGAWGAERGQSTISGSYATSAVTGVAEVGGLVGWNMDSSTVTGSYASGQVSGTARVGGLAGVNKTGAEISDSYANGAVSGVSQVGGLVGNQTAEAIFEDPMLGLAVGAGDPGTVRRSHASGAVSGTSELGGLVGAGEPGSVVASYWDKERSGQAASAGGTALTSAQMTQAASFEGWDLATTGGSDAVWRLYEGRAAPLLRGFLKPITVTVADDGKVYDGQAYGGGPGVSFSGAVDDSLLRGQGSYAGSAQGAKDAGSYTIASGLYSVQQGYDLAETAGTLTVTPATLEVSVDEVSASQGQAFPGWTPRVSGLVAGERLEDVVEGTLHLQDPPSMTAAPGEYRLTPAGYALRGGNYVLAYRAGTLHLAPYVPSTLPASYHAALHGAAHGGQARGEGEGCGQPGCPGHPVPSGEERHLQDSRALPGIVDGGLRLPQGQEEL